MTQITRTRLALSLCLSLSSSPPDLYFHLHRHLHRHLHLVPPDQQHPSHDISIPSNQARKEQVLYAQQAPKGSFHVKT